VTGFNAMLGLIYDFIGRIPQADDDESEPDGTGSRPAPREESAVPGRAQTEKSGDNAR